MVESTSNKDIDYFDGQKILLRLLTIQKPITRFVYPIEVTSSKPVDLTDIKLIGFLKGLKVCFTQEELERYVIDLSLLDKQLAKDDN